MPVLSEELLPLDDTATIVVRDLGRMSYTDAFELQKDSHARVLSERPSADATPVARSMYLLLVEHDPPVITVSRRKTAKDNLVATPATLARAGVEVAETDRGGDITYHGPGQLVAYPIIDLNHFHFRLHQYMRLLEQTVIETIAAYGIEGHRDEEATGVWVRPSHVGNGAAAKIAAMGVRVSRWVTMHGLALNVSTNLEHFNLIIPCGLAGRRVTSVAQELGRTGSTPSMSDVKRELVQRFLGLLQNAGNGAGNGKSEP